MSFFPAPFPEEYHIRIDDISEATQDFYNKPGFLKQPSSFEDWRKTIFPPLRKIAATRSGLILLRALKATGKWTRISPPWKPECNANGGNDNTRDSAGRYDSATLNFDPRMFMSGSSCYKIMDLKPGSPGAQPDEVLFHELIHAYRGILHSDQHSPVFLHGGLKRYEIAEEFFAVMLTNIYVSDVSNRHSSGLRADHVHHHPLAKELSHSFTFFQSSTEVLTLVDQLVKENNHLATELSKVKAGFNPLAAYFQNWHAVKFLSQTPMAKLRDFVIERLPIMRGPVAPPLPTVPEATPLEMAARYLKDNALAILRGHP
jgi:hypothetical protein